MSATTRELAAGKAANSLAQPASTSPQELSQQEFLRHAMAILGMTQKEFAQRLRVPPRTFEKWLLPDSSKDHRRMPEMAWSYVEDVLRWEGES